jgi:hypothetical protein
MHLLRSFQALLRREHSDVDEAMLKRLNQEECRLRRLDLEMSDDKEARQRIKDRMVQGVACTHLAWFQDHQRKRKQPRRNRNIVTMPLRKVEP